MFKYGLYFAFRWFVSFLLLSLGIEIKTYNYYEKNNDKCSSS